jgi:hypothetical protein
MRGRDKRALDELATPPAGRWIASILLAILLVPAVRRALEATMLAQMLVQIPLLAAFGWLSLSFLPMPARARIDRWNANGISGLVVASLGAMYWMLPRALDAAVADAGVAALKFVSVPLVIGLPLALSWPRAGFVVRGVFLAEVIATLFRLGWLYRVSPVRLCSAYPLDDQQRLGTSLLVLGTLLFAFVAYSLVFGDWRRRPASIGVQSRYDRATLPATSRR